MSQPHKPVMSMGLDLSLTSTGIAVLSKSLTSSASSYVTRVKTTGKKNDSIELRRLRLASIIGEITDEVEAFYPHLVVVEAPSYGSRFGSAHDRSGLWWKAVDAVRSMGIQLAAAPPQSRAKYATGKGNAEKAYVEERARETYRHLGIAWPAGKCDDVADAVVLAAMGMRKLGVPVEDAHAMTDVRLASMDGVEWPAELVA